jgi:riboflavin biosynthesis pyrimidine reductase
VRVTLHYAQSLDGRIATCTGDSQWIGGPASLRLAHQLRAEHAAVLVGLGTVLADNPRLTVRLVDGRSPRRVVLDSRLRLPLTTNVLVDGAAPTVVATTPAAPPERVAAVRDRGVDVQVEAPVRERIRGHVDDPHHDGPAQIHARRLERAQVTRGPRGPSSSPRISAAPPANPGRGSGRGPSRFGSRWAGG